MDKARTTGADAITAIEMLRYELASLTSRLLSLYHENMMLRQFLDNKNKRHPPETCNYSRGRQPIHQ